MWTTLPKADAFLPLVFLVTALLPWLSLWFYGRLMPEQASAGLIGLDWAAGWMVDEALGEPQTVTPPLVGWLTALFLLLPGPIGFWVLGLPSYLAAIGSLVVIYKIGKMWSSSGTGLLASFFVGFNSVFLEQVATGRCGPIVLLLALLAMLLHGQHLRRGDDVFCWRTGAAALVFAGLFLTSGMFTLWLPILALLYWVYERAGRRDTLAEMARSAWSEPTVRATGLSLIAGFLIALPWLWPAASTGQLSAWADASIGTGLPITLSTLLFSTPVPLVLGIYGASKSFIEYLLSSGVEPSPEAAPLLWLAVAGLALATTDATPAAYLFLSVPLALLAARTIFLILSRTVHDEMVVTLALMAIWAFAISQTSALSGLPGWLFQPTPISAEQLLDAHLGLDLLIVVGLALLSIYHWSAGRDSERRLLLGGLVVGMLILTMIPGLGTLQGTLRRDDPWIKVAAELERIHEPDLLVFLGPQPGDRLRFVARNAFPRVPQFRVERREDFEALVREHGDRPIVLVTEESYRLPASSSILLGDRSVTVTQIFDNERVTLYAPVEAPGP